MTNFTEDVVNGAGIFQAVSRRFGASHRSKSDTLCRKRPLHSPGERPRISIEDTSRMFAYDLYEATEWHVRYHDHKNV